MAVDRESLLRLVRASGEDEARIVFADWLEEQGEVARAQLIHLQCEQARLSRWDGRALDAGWEIDWLLFEHGERFRAELPALDGVEWADFERGFVSTVRVTTIGRLLEVAVELAAAAPVTRAEVAAGAEPHHRDEAPTPAWLRAIRIGADAAALASNEPHAHVLAEIEELELRDVDDALLDWLVLPGDAKLVRLRVPDGRELGHDFLRAIASQPWGKRLRELDVSSRYVPVDTGYGPDPDPRLGADGGKLLARLDRLERLVVDRQRIASKAFGELFAKLPRLTELSARECGIVKIAPLSSTGAPLRRLAVPQNAFGNAGLGALARAPRLAQVEALDVDTCELESLAVIELAKSPMWQTLRWLDLSRNPLGIAGARALCEAPPPPHLASLRIADADLDAAAANVLGKLGWLAQLVELDLSGNRITTSAAVLRNFAPERLRSLGLAATGLERSEAAVLARFWPHLVRLAIGHNTIGDAGIERFAVMKEAPRLQSLAMNECQLTDDGLELLARARCPRLRELSLHGNAFGARGLAAMLRAPLVSRLEVLDLSRCDLDGAAIDAIARASLPRLVHLKLRGNELPAAALVRLAESSSLANVKIDVDGTPYAYEPAVRDRLAARFGETWYRAPEE